MTGRKRIVCYLICMICCLSAVSALFRYQTKAASSLSAPSDVVTAEFRYDALKISWSPVAEADGYNVYIYRSSSNKYEKIGSTAGLNYIVYGLTPGVTYSFRVCARADDPNGAAEGPLSAVAKGKAGEALLASVNAKAPTPMFTVIDDDTRDAQSVKLFHDLCERNGIRGNYAVVCSHFSDAGADGYDTMLAQLLDYEQQGFGMLLHCYSHDARFTLKSRTNGWSKYTAAQCQQMSVDSMRRGKEAMIAAGFATPTEWVAPMGVHDAAIREAAIEMGLDCLIGVANKSYVGYHPSSDGYNRYFIPRVELYGTDGALDASRGNRMTGRHSTDRIWNSMADVKAQIDAAAEKNAWVIICTHVYESEWYLPRIVLTRTADGYRAETTGEGLTVSWTDTGASLTQESYTFIYDERSGVVDWYEEDGSVPVRLADYGVSLTGTPVYTKADPAADTDRSGFFEGRFREVVQYAKSKGMTNVTFPEGYSYWREVYDTAEAAERCHVMTPVAAAAARCNQSGYSVAHYQCAECGRRFLDEQGHTELDEQIVLPAQPGAHTDADGDSRCDHCGIDLTKRPKTPNDLIATAGVNQVLLTWSPVENATLYSIYRYNETLRNYKWIGESVAAQYTDCDLPAGVTQYFKIRAVRVTEEGKLFSALSAADHAAPQPMTASCRATEANALTVSWVEVPEATQYNVYRFNDLKNDYVYIGTTFSVSAVPTQYVDRGLRAGYVYSYKVIAYRKTNSLTQVRARSAAVSARAIAVPDVPQQVTAEATAARTLTVSWAAVPGATQYNVYRYNGAKKAYVYKGTTFASAAVPTQYVDQGLYSGTTYHYRIVAAVKTDSLTLVSERSASACAKVVGVPAAPKNVAVRATGSNELTVSWSAVPDATQYNIYRYNGTKKAYVYKGTSFVSSARPTQYTDRGLYAGTNYYYKVVAVIKTGKLTLVSERSASAHAMAVSDV